MKIDVRALVIEAGIAIAIGVVLAAVGPFGSYSASFARRLAYWVPLILLGYAIMRPTLLLADPVARRLDLPGGAVATVLMAIANGPLSLIIFWFNGHWPRVPTLDLFFQHYVNVGIITAIVLVVYLLVEGRPAAAAASEVGGGPKDGPPSRFHERLPPGFALKALENEDHYVRAHGEDGRSELILIRLRDAIAELDGLDGAQVHRGWWVARDAVVGWRRDGRRLFLDLGDGLEAPVARDRQPQLRKLGYLD